MLLCGSVKSRQTTVPIGTSNKACSRLAARRSPGDGCVVGRGQGQECGYSSQRAWKTSSCMGVKLSKHSLSVRILRVSRWDSVLGISIPRIRRETVSCSGPPVCRGTRPELNQPPTLNRAPMRSGRTRHQNRGVTMEASSNRVWCGRLLPAVLSPVSPGGWRGSTVLVLLLRWRSMALSIGRGSVWGGRSRCITRVQIPSPKPSHPVLFGFPWRCVWSCVVITSVLSYFDTIHLQGDYSSRRISVFTQ